MDKNEGWICLYRKFLQWEWYSDFNVKTLFLHCLLRANHKEKKWRGQIIEAGSFVTSSEKLSIETGLTISQVRTALSKLKMTGEIASKGHSRYSVISIKNWHEFQENDKQNGKQMTNESQPNDKQMTTNNNDNNENNISSSSSSSSSSANCKISQKLYGKYKNVCLSQKQYDKLVALCASDIFLNEIVNSLSVNIETGKEQPYRAHLPNAHYERLKSYYEYRRKNPRKIVNNSGARNGKPMTSDKSHIFDELRLLAGGADECI